MRTMIHINFGATTKAHDAKTNEKTRAMEKHVGGIFRSLIVNYVYIRFGPLQMDVHDNEMIFHFNGIVRHFSFVFISVA